MQPHANVELEWHPNIWTADPEEMYFQFYVERIHVLPSGDQVIHYRKLRKFRVYPYYLRSEHILEEKVASMISHLFFPSLFTDQLNALICDYVLVGSEPGHPPYLKIEIYMYRDAEEDELSEEEGEEEAMMDVLEVDIEEEMEIPFPEEMEVEQALMDSMEEGLGGGGDFGGIPASKDSIKQLKASKYDKIQGEGACSICFDDFDVGTEVKRMPCSHLFHGDCIARWLENSHVCPLCRYRMPTDNDED